MAEDDDINYVYMERLLLKTNANILRAANGQEAVDICNSNRQIDLILMDINMPFMNGQLPISQDQRPQITNHCCNSLFAEW
ncbi:MAG: response regulator [Bacteroidales bacterium]|nr:response regulator [Bacteroidales bacterium]